MGSYCKLCDSKIKGNDEYSYNDTGMCEACNIIKEDRRVLKVMLNDIHTALTAIEEGYTLQAVEQILKKNYETFKDFTKILQRLYIKK